MATDVGLRAILEPEIDERAAERASTSLKDQVEETLSDLTPNLSGLGSSLRNVANAKMANRVGIPASIPFSGGGGGSGGLRPLMEEQVELLEVIAEAVDEDFVGSNTGSGSGGGGGLGMMGWLKSLLGGGGLIGGGGLLSLLGLTMGGSAAGIGAGWLLDQFFDFEPLGSNDIIQALFSGEKIRTAEMVDMLFGEEGQDLANKLGLGEGFQNLKDLFRNPPTLEEILQPENIPTLGGILNPEALPSLDDMLQPGEVDNLNDIINPDTVPGLAEVLNPDSVADLGTILGMENVPTLFRLLGMDNVPTMRELLFGDGGQDQPSQTRPVNSGTPDDMRDPTLARAANRAEESKRGEATVNMNNEFQIDPQRIARNLESEIERRINDAISRLERDLRKEKDRGSVSSAARRYSN